jgi:hypothetical protein
MTKATAKKFDDDDEETELAEILDYDLGLTLEKVKNENGSFTYIIHDGDDELDEYYVLPLETLNDVRAFVLSGLKRRKKTA